eukprot:scaffold47102_cov22-Prasinocladus_malaysianus.AAC.3
MTSKVDGRFRLHGCRDYKIACVWPRSKAEFPKQLNIMEALFHVVNDQANGIIHGILYFHNAIKKAEICNVELSSINKIIIFNK